MRTINPLFTRRVVLTCFVLAVLSGLSSIAGTVIVTSPADEGPGSLRKAIADSSSGDTVLFDPGLSGQSIVLTNGNIVLGRDLTVDASALPAGVQISGNNSSQIFLVAANVSVVLRGLTLRNGAGGGDDGGALRNVGTLALERCTFTANSTGSGGAIKNDRGATLTLTQCTLSGNASVPWGGGGGIVNYAKLTLIHCTVAGNQSGFGGGIYNETGGGDLTLINTIVAGNQSPNIFNFGLLTLLGANLLDSEPQLAPLGNYGGATPTRPPLPGSPAVDAGDDTQAVGLAADQRGAGFPRLSGDHVDIGAVERQLVASPTAARLGGSAVVDGKFQFSFANEPGASFRVLATADFTLPETHWSLVGFAIETAPGQFQFTDLESANLARRFYRVRSP